MAHDQNPVASHKGAEMNAGPHDTDVMREKEGPSGLAQFSAVMMWGISVFSFLYKCSHRIKQSAFLIAEVEQRVRAGTLVGRIIAVCTATKCQKQNRDS